MGDTPKILRLGVLTPVAGLDPRESHDMTGNLVIRQVFEPPYRRNDAGGYEPVLFEGLMQERGDGSYAATVREGLKFSDGSLVTAEDIVQALKVLPSLDDWLLSAAGDAVVVKPRGSVRGRPEEALSDRPVSVVKEVDGQILGTGPFLVAEHTDDLVRLAPNPHAARAPGVEGIEIQHYPVTDGGRPEALLAAVQSGEVDFTVALSRDDVPALDNARKLFLPGMSTAILFMNTEKDHFKSADTRRAVAACVDRYKLTQLCYENPAAFVARSLLPPGLGKHTDSLRHDPSASLPRGTLPETLTLVTVWGPRPYLPRPRQVAAALADQLGRLGVRVEVVHAESSDAYFKRLRSGKYDLVLGGWNADTTDPLDYLRSTVSSGGIPAFGRSPATTANYARLDDPEIDRILNAGRRGGAERSAAAILDRVSQLVPLVPIMYGPRVIVHAWRVKGFNPEGILPDLTGVTLED